MTFTIDVKNSRRQPYIGQLSYENTLKHQAEDYLILEEGMRQQVGNPFETSLGLQIVASHKWFAFQLAYTAGAELQSLSNELSEVVAEFGRYADEVALISEDQYFYPFILDDLIDTYIDYLHLLCFAILLHRQDLIPRIYSFIAGTEYDGGDAVIEELLTFFLPDRPEIDEWIWERPYRDLLVTIDEPDTSKRALNMKKYVKQWYSSMKGQAGFHGKHTKIDDSFSPYSGYWAMCAAAFTYLYGIDDSGYRDELVYPKDLVDYARSRPRAPVASEGGALTLRILGGEPCPRTGTWSSPAHAGSSRHFTAGDLMLVFENSEYGATIWQWTPSA